MQTAVLNEYICLATMKGGLPCRLLVKSVGGSKTDEQMGTRYNFICYVVMLCYVLLCYVMLFIWSEMQLRSKSIRSWCDGSSDRSFMVDPYSCFSFQPVLHDSVTKAVVYVILCGMMHVKKTLLLIGNNSLCGGRGFPFSLSEWSFTII